MFQDKMECINLLSLSHSQRRGWSDSGVLKHILSTLRVCHCRGFMGKSGNTTDTCGFGNGERFFFFFFLRALCRMFYFL